MYTIEEIRKKITPIAEAHRLKSIWLIGSYARGEATENSDIDLLYDKEGSDITSLVKASAMYADITELFGIPVDLVSVKALKQSICPEATDIFVKNIEKDRVILYDRA